MAITAADRVRSLVEDFGGQAEVARALGVDRSRVTRWLRDAAPDATNQRSSIGRVRDGAPAPDLPPRDRRLVALRPERPSGDRRPIDLLADGRVSEVLAAIEAEETGAYA